MAKAHSGPQHRARGRVSRLQVFAERSRMLQAPMPPHPSSRSRGGGRLVAISAPPKWKRYPFADGTFDAVTGFNSFRSMRLRRRNALCEARRVSEKAALTPGIVAVWGLPEGCGRGRASEGPLARRCRRRQPALRGPFTAYQTKPSSRRSPAKPALTPSAVVDVPCAWVYAEPRDCTRGMLSAGPAERAIRASSFERAREAVAASIEPYRTASGGYRLNNTFRYLVARS